MIVVSVGVFLAGTSGFGSVRRWSDAQGDRHDAGPLVALRLVRERYFFSPLMTVLTPSTPLAATSRTAFTADSPMSPAASKAPVAAAEAASSTLRPTSLAPRMAPEMAPGRDLDDIAAHFAGTLNEAPGGVLHRCEDIPADLGGTCDGAGDRAGRRADHVAADVLDTLDGRAAQCDRGFQPGSGWCPSWR